MAAEALICIATHNGPFHSDDVLSVAILSRIFNNHRIIRTRDPELLETADFCVDVGGEYSHVKRRYDHHMRYPPRDSYGHMYSSAGLIWYHYSTAYLRKIGMPKTYPIDDFVIDLYDQIHKLINMRWICPIDKNDNGVVQGPTPISDIVNAMGPIDVERSKERYDALFLEVVKIVSNIFERTCFHTMDYIVSTHRFSMCNKETLSDGKILIAEAEARQFGHLVNSDAHFVIYPGKDISETNPFYVVRPIYRPFSKEYKTRIPYDILGASKEELSSKGYTGISFVHHNGFMIRADNKESAISFCEKLLNME